MVAYIFLLIGGFGAVYFGAEWLVRGSARIASTLGVSPVVVGLTIVALGTSAPELVVSVLAVIHDHPDLVIGNIVGSNLANIGLILGATAMIRPLAVADRVIFREVPIMIVITVCMLPVVLSGSIEPDEGILLLALLLVYVAFTFRSAERDKTEILDTVSEVTDEPTTESQTRVILRNLGRTVAGGVGLTAGGWAIVQGVEFLTEEFGISEMWIGITVVAVGTSLPELATSVVAIVKHHADIAIGNIVGSNIFNLTAVLGTAAVLSGSGNLDVGGVQKEMFAVLGISILLWPVVATSRKVGRLEGMLLLVAYFLILIVVRPDA